jgi:hypothetical protein
MKKFILIALIVIVTAGTALAQTIPYSVVKSDLFKDEYSNSYLVHAAEDNNGGSIIVRAFEASAIPLPRGYAFEHYDADMKKLKEYKYEGKGQILGIIIKEEKISIIETDYSKERKSFVWTAYTARIDDFAFTSKELYSFESKRVDLYRYSASEGIMLPAFEMVVNADNSAFAIVVDILGKEKRNEIHLFDSSLERKFMHNIPGGCCFRSFNYKNLNVSPDGNSIYLLSKVYTSETRNKDDGGGYQYEIFKITASGAEKQVFATEEHFIPAIHAVTVSDKIACVGFYSNKDDYRSKGVCYFEVDPVAFKIVKKKYSPFTEQFMIDKYGKVKDKEIKHLVLKNVAVLLSGEIVLDAQEEYKEVNRRSGTGHSWTKYYFDDIVNVKLTKDGDIVYARNINKRQSTEYNFSHLSYTSAVKEGDSFFLINTDARVRELSGGRVEFGQAALRDWSHLNLVRVKEDGGFDYEEISGENENTVLYAAGFGITTKNAMYVLGEAKGQKKQILKVNLN